MSAPPVSETCRDNRCDSAIGTGEVFITINSPDGMLDPECTKMSTPYFSFHVTDGVVRQSIMQTQALKTQWVLS